MGDTELPTTAEGATVGAHDPREWGYKATCQHATTIPGYWPDEDRQHGLLLIHHRVNNHMKQMCASKGWKEENLAQLEHDGNKARFQSCSICFKGGKDAQNFHCLTIF